eukprot:scaffold8760_cov116-Isochrysis_galbana.AAC.13
MNVATRQLQMCRTLSLPVPARCTLCGVCRRRSSVPLGRKWCGQRKALTRDKSTLRFWAPASPPPARFPSHGPAGG